MDKMMSSKVGSVAVPLAAGAGAAFGGPQGARGMSMALGAMQMQQQLREQQRISELLSKEFEPPDVTSTDSVIAGRQNPSSGEIDGMRRLGQVFAQTGDIDGALKVMKEIANISSPMEVTKGSSLMSRTGELLGTAPIPDPFRIQGSENQVIDQTNGNVIPTPATLDRSARGWALADSDIARDASAMGVDTSRISANNALVGQRNAVADKALAQAEATRNKVQSGKTGADGAEQMALADITKQIKEITTILQDATLPSGQRKNLEMFLENLVNQLNALNESAVPVDDEGNIRVEPIKRYEGPSPSGDLVFNPQTGQVEPRQ